MGFALSWLAVRQKSPAEVHAALGLRATDARGELGDAPVLGAPAKCDWYLIVAEGAEHPYLAPAIATHVSAACELLTCTVEEHVMFSQASGWRDGRLVWSVTHRGEDGPVGLDVTGDPPSDLAGIRARFEARQAAEGGADADVDHLFEIPVVLVQQFTGFKHDEPSPEVEAAGFAVLESVVAPPSKRSWVDRLMGR
jgi:hypothetical protein